MALCKIPPPRENPSNERRLVCVHFHTIRGMAVSIPAIAEAFMAPRQAPCRSAHSFLSTDFRRAPQRRAAFASSIPGTPAGDSGP